MVNAGRSQQPTTQELAGDKPEQKEDHQREQQRGPVVLGLLWRSLVRLHGGSPHNEQHTKAGESNDADHN